MIGAAILQTIRNNIQFNFPDARWFYEDLPLDMNGDMTKYGVFAETLSASMSQNSNYHVLINIYVAIGEGARNRFGAFIAEKAETDKLVDAIQDEARLWLSRPSQMIELIEEETGETFRDVRVFPTASKVRGITLANGAIVKNIALEVYYKK